MIDMDNLNNYYDVRLKQTRIAQNGSLNQFYFLRLDLTDRNGANKKDG